MAKKHVCLDLEESEWDAMESLRSLYTQRAGFDISKKAMIMKTVNEALKREKQIEKDLIKQAEECI